MYQSTRQIILPPLRSPAEMVLTKIFAFIICVAIALIWLSVRLLAKVIGAFLFLWLVLWVFLHLLGSAHAAAGSCPGSSPSTGSASTQQGFTVSADKGFVGPNGTAWNIHGVDVDLGDALQNLPGLLKNYPNMTAIRLVANGNTDTVANIAPVIQAYTSHGIVVELEDHADSQNGDNTGWYGQMASAFKSNPYVFLETPNEPPANEAGQNQVDIIQAIRATGFSNPIGIQSIGGWDQTAMPYVVSQVGTQNLYVTSHVYYDGSDPNAPAQEVQQYIQRAAANGMYDVIDEFGNAEDGWNMNPQGNAVLTAVEQANEAGQAGAIAWAAGNGYHPDGADSACTDVTCSQLTSMGSNLASWVSQSTAPGSPACPIPQVNPTSQSVQQQFNFPPPPPIPTLAVPLTGQTAGESGALQPATGHVKDVLQMCADPATNAANPQLCALVFQAQGSIQQTQGQEEPSQVQAVQHDLVNTPMPSMTNVQPPSMSDINAQISGAQSQAAEAASLAAQAQQVGNQYQGWQRQ